MGFRLDTLSLILLISRFYDSGMAIWLGFQRGVERGIIMAYSMAFSIDPGTVSGMAGIFCHSAWRLAWHLVLTVVSFTTIHL
jgi:hypothetical protein